MDHCLIQVIENWFKDVWTLNIDWQVTSSNSEWPLFEPEKGLQLYFRVSEVWSSSVWGEIEHWLYSNMSRDTFSHSSHSGEGTVDRFLAIFSTRHFSASDLMRRAELQETQSTRKLPVLPATVSEFTVLLERNSVRSNFDWNPCFDPRFTGMFRRKAFLHWYTGEGMVRLQDFFLAVFGVTPALEDDGERTGLDSWSASYGSRGLPTANGGKYTSYCIQHLAISSGSNLQFSPFYRPSQGYLPFEVCSDWVVLAVMNVIALKKSWTEYIQQHWHLLEKER